ARRRGGRRQRDRAAAARRRRAGRRGGVRRRAPRRARRPLAARVIKSLGSKRRLVPALTAICHASGARTALDLFTGTTRVAQAFKRCGVHVTAVDTARYADVFARCYVATDRSAVDGRELDAVLAELD